MITSILEHKTKRVRGESGLYNSGPHSAKIGKKVMVSFSLDGGQTFSVTLLLDHNTVEETIRLAIVKLNNVCKLQLDPTSDQYELYFARKSGKKKQDLPALCPNQVIHKTGVQRFALCFVTEKPSTDLIWRKSNSQEEKLFSMKSIQTDYNFGLKSSNNFELEEAKFQKSKGIRCFCL